MALDTRYRPLHFDDVIGQEGTVQVLRQFVQSGSGFHQSYLFCGSHGSGKTSLARILARALLCENPREGNPCDACDSCKSIIDRGTNECFVEVDAATNSGKDDIRQIVDRLKYDTFSGRRRIYLFDEAHRLSKDALDALLKPMEDTVSTGDDKLLVCIFCTTEPEKMRATIFSRCAPAFVIRQVSPEIIAERLAYVCDTEHIPYDRPALVTIAEAVECHIRDALKSVEGVSMLGHVNIENVRSYLRLNANVHYVKVIGYIGKNLAAVLSETHKLQEVVSPTTVYERLADLAMLAYRVGLGVGKPPSYWDASHIAGLWTIHQSFLLQIAQVMAIKPGHPTFAMLECDLAALHMMRAGVGVVPPVTRAILPQGGGAPVQDKAGTGSIDPVVHAPITQPVGKVEQTPVNGEIKPVPTLTKGGVYIDPRGVNKRHVSNNTTSNIQPLEIDAFRKMLRRQVAELAVNGRQSRSAR